MPAYSESNDLNLFGQDLIERIHPGLNVLKIVFLFRDKASHAQGRIVPARTRRCEDRDRQLHGADFIIEVAREVWDQTDQRFREAILDHELTSFGAVCDEEGVAQKSEDGRVKTFSRKPDIQEFTEVMERHGAYHVELRAFLTKLEEREEEKVESQDTEPAETENVEDTSVSGEATVELENDILWGEPTLGSEVDELTLTLDGEATVDFEDVIPTDVELEEEEADIELPELR